MNVVFDYADKFFCAVCRSLGAAATETRPISPARKRRLARDVVKSYKPGYTWNRGGRLKELRIR